MTASIWLIAYGLDPEQELAYLDWFHHVHIPEKLARPGYTWAAHYRSDSDVVLGDGRSMMLYVALFGGQQSRIFYTPCPAQLAPRQPERTKEMMGCRIGSQTHICASEWTLDPKGNLTSDEKPIEAEKIGLSLVGTGGHDMRFSAWLTQEHAPRLNGVGLRKLLASSGSPRHVMLYSEGQGSLPQSDDFKQCTDSWFDSLFENLNFRYAQPIVAMRRIA